MKEKSTVMYARNNFGRLLDKNALLATTHIVERTACLLAALGKLIPKNKGENTRKLTKVIAEA